VRSVLLVGLGLLAGTSAGLVGCPSQTELSGDFAAGQDQDQGQTRDDSAAPQTEDQQQEDAEQVDLAREIEEADIIKLESGFFYLANPFRGLRIIDVTDPANPALAGGLPLGGRGVELFVRDGRAYVFTSADFYFCAGRPIGFAESDFESATSPDFTGSRLWVVDVSDPADPQLLSQLDFDGYVTATRRVGDVIYAAGNVLLDFNEPNRPTDGGQGSPDDVVSSPDIYYYDYDVFVTSINIADPLDTQVVETETFTGTSLDMQVSQDAIYVLGNEYNFDQTTLVTYVDISDPAGAITPRDQFRVPGFVQNRFFVDEFEDTLRIVTEDFDQQSFATVVALFNYDVSNPDDITRITRLPIISGESLRAVRFDGIRGYAVTFLQIDPLFVLDLADAANPSVSGELEVPGFSTHMVPLGERLVGVGFDDTNGTRPAVSLYDVTDPENPSQLSRIIVGEEGSFDTYSEATVDEKALKVLEDAGLILLPFSSFDGQSGDYVDSLQLIEMSADALTQRGVIDHPGLVRRAGLLEQTVWVLSDRAFQTVDVADLANPASLATVEIISEQELLDAGLSGCADSARFHGLELGLPLFFDDIGFGDFFPYSLLSGACAPVAGALFTTSLIGMRLTRKRRSGCRR